MEKVKFKPVVMTLDQKKKWGAETTSGFGILKKNIWWVYLDDITLVKFRKNKDLWTCVGIPTSIKFKKVK